MVFDSFTDILNTFSILMISVLLSAPSDFISMPHSITPQHYSFDVVFLAQIFIICGWHSYMRSCMFFLWQPATVRHHWVHRRRQEGKCKQCGKVCIMDHKCSDIMCLRHYMYISKGSWEWSLKFITESDLHLQGFQQKFAFHSKEIVAISCSWCKQAVSLSGYMQ